jgi:hypothetical protein
MRDLVLSNTGEASDTRLRRQMSGFPMTKLCSSKGTALRPVSYIRYQLLPKSGSS